MEAEPFQNATGVGVKLTYTSKDGEEGYPGTVQADVTYTLTDKGELVVDYHATTDKTTVINLTQHSYFNLAGAKANDILGHELTINADQYTPVDATLIPTGTARARGGHAVRFPQVDRDRRAHQRGDAQIKRGLGYDHNWVLNRTGDGLSLAARVVEPVTGRTMEITTTEPGIQFYSGNFLRRTARSRARAAASTGIAPGSASRRSTIPTRRISRASRRTVLKPGQEYRSKTVFTFGTSK